MPLASTILRNASLIGAALSVSGCARRAPGPEQCHELALRMERTTGAPSGRSLGLPELFDGLRDDGQEDNRVLQRTTECLTTPYDRKLVQCVTSGASIARCWRGFEGRRGREIPMYRLPGETEEP